MRKSFPQELSMIEKKYLDIIICPVCKGELVIEKNAINCINCKRKYRIQDGILVLLPDELPIDASISREKWSGLYKKHKVAKNYKNNETIVSIDNFLLKYKKFFSKGIFLDLGCGITWNGALLAKKGASLLGIDISYEGLYKSKLLFSQEKLKGCFVQGSFKYLPFKDNSVQFIYAGLSVLEYEKDMEASLLEAYRVLKPGGRMIGTFPVASLTTLTYQQLRGDIPNIPLIKPIAQFVHVNLFKGKYLRYGYGQTSFTRHIKGNFKKTPFKILDVDCFNMFYPINFVPSMLKPFVRRLLRFRLFWPVAYIEAVKP